MDLNRELYLRTVLFVETGQLASTMELPLVMVAKGSSGEVSERSMPTVVDFHVTVPWIRTKETSVAIVGLESASKQE